MTNLHKVANYILTGILIAFLILSAVLVYIIDTKNKKIVQLDEQLYRCINAPVIVDTIYDTIYLTQAKYIYPKAKENPNKDEWDEFKQLSQSVAQSSNSGCDNTHSSYYSEVYDKDGVKIHWNALAECNNDSAQIALLEFTDIVVPKEIVTKTIQVEKPIEVPAKLTNKFLLYGGPHINSLSKFPAIEVGAGFLHKQNWTILVGGTYLDNKMYGTIKIGIVL